MPSGKDEAVRYRTLAAWARATAEEITDPDARAIMLKIAENYEDLARRAEEGHK
jgi:hypothetical protein